MRRCLFSVGWGTGHFNPLLVSEMLQPIFSSLLFAAHIYSWTVEAVAKEQAIVLDPQERRTVADCGHNA